jgi:hypothetical protein
MKIHRSFILVLLIGVALALALGITYAGASTGGSATRPDVGAAPLGGSTDPKGLQRPLVPYQSNSCPKSKDFEVMRPPIALAPG